MDPVVVAIVVAYLAAMLLVGWLAARKVTESDDFLVAGRRLGPLMMAGTLAATEVGGGSSLGVVEKAYGPWGLSASWYVLAMAITFVVLAWIAPRLRSTEVRTVPEFFRQRYGRASALLTALLFLLPLVGLTAVQLIASATIVTVMSGASYHAAVVVVCVVVTIYSVLGGLWSVTLTDIVQLVLIVGGLTLALPFALEAAGGWQAVWAQIPAHKASPIAGTGWSTVVSLVVMYLASFAVGQETVQRYFAARDASAARWGSLTAAAIYVAYAAVPALLGLTAYAMTKSGALSDQLIASQGARYVLPVLAQSTMPSVLVGVVFAALISATMSSADSDLLAAGSIFANDIYVQYLAPEASDARRLRVTRVTMVLCALAALGIALANPPSIIDLLVFSFSVRAGGACVPYLLGHYLRGASTTGALLALVGGSGAVVVAKHPALSRLGLEPVLAGLGVSLTLFVLGNLLSRDRQR